MFPVINVDRRRSEAIEPLGTKRKFWFTAADGTRTLFKAEERGTGEDWAEKATCEFARLLGLPHVHYELAIEVESDTPGVVCATCAPHPIELRLGNQLLQTLDPEYPDGKRYHVSTHTIEAVARVVAGLEPPLASSGDRFPDGVSSATDIFTGFLLLDAWVANQDRHHENWGALAFGESRRLAPTFDHGASLARNISDDERLERMESRDANRRIPAYARKARSALYQSAADKKALTTTAAWHAFLDLAPDSAAWLDRLCEIDEATVTAVFDRIPPDRMSNVCRKFTVGLMMENRRRLLDGERE